MDSTLCFPYHSKISAVETAFCNGSNGYSYLSEERRLDTQWFQLGADIGGENTGDKFDYSVALSQDRRTVAIGAHYNDGNGSWSGHVRIFERQGETWVQVGHDIDGKNINDQSG